MRLNRGAFTFGVPRNLALPCMGKGMAVKEAGLAYRPRESVSTHLFIVVATLLCLVIGWAPPAADARDVADIGCCEVVGDADHSGAIKASDIIALINYLFRSGPLPPCLKEADANSDGITNMADVIFLVAYVFRGGVPPAECPLSIVITNLQPGDDTVHGMAYVPDTAKYRVVLWAKTDRWYVQPLITEPYTAIRSDGSWSNHTNPWDRITALLVDTGYLPLSPREEHPSDDSGVVDWDEYPEPSPDGYIDWSGYRWRVKKASLTGPGPNAFSDDTANVWIDRDDRLHLKIDFRNDRWYCAEIVLDHALGYGVYTFRLDSRVDSLDHNTIFAGFLFDTTAQEFDMEFSHRLANPFNAQFVVQPWYLPGHIDYYDMPAHDQTSFSFEWRADRIIFQSWNGHGLEPQLTTLIHSWTYTGDDLPIPHDDRVRFNLYLFGGEPPSGGSGDEVIITSFEYAP